VRRWLAVLCLASLAWLAAACEEEIMAPGEAGTAPGGAKAKATASAGADAGAPEAGAFVMEFSETDFVENDESRDPFRDFAGLFLKQAKQRTIVQRKVLASVHALDELKLSGIISRGERRALVTDPNGLGWVLRTGDYVGKSEMVSTGGPTGVDVALNWRVDRIRETDVVFLREDPAHPEIPPTTKVMYLHPVGEGDLPGMSG
jgi:type IV pilus assembly protein PilP